MFVKAEQVRDNLGNRFSMLEKNEGRRFVMKKLWLCLCLLLALAISGVVLAADVAAPRESNEITTQLLKKISGTWYYTNGNQALVVTPTTISGAVVEGGYGFVGGDPGSGLFRITSTDGIMSELRIGWHFASTDSSHQYLFLNGRPLRRSWEANYSESIGGVFLGMSREEAVRTLGQPDRESKEKKILYYDKKGLQLGLDNGIVYNITVAANSPLNFENSNLKATAPLEDFKQRYGLPRLPVVGNDGGPNRIADGEYLWFTNYPQSVMLSLYDN